MYNLVRLNQEDIENMNRPITSNETESVIEKLPINKSAEPEVFTGEFYQTFSINTYSSQTIPKNCRGRNSSKFILQGQHQHQHPDTKTRQRYHKKKITSH